MVAERRSALFVVALLAACGGASGGSDAGGSDATRADARPPRDVSPPVVRMYVHTAESLYLIDNVTFDLTIIGDFDAPDDDQMTDLAITSDGSIFTISQTKLYRVDRNTAEATLIGDVPGKGNVGMTFLTDGRLLATDQDGGVRSIDPETGDVTEIGEFGGGYATAGDLVAISDGRLFAISDAGPEGDEYESNVLLTVDSTTGTYTESIGQIGYGGVFGAAVANNHVYAFTREGDIIEIDPDTGAGAPVRSYPDVAFWGAGVSPLAVID